MTINTNTKNLRQFFPLCLLLTLLSCSFNLDVSNKPRYSKVINRIFCTQDVGVITAETFGPTTGQLYLWGRGSESDQGFQFYLPKSTRVTIAKAVRELNFEMGSSEYLIVEFQHGGKTYSAIMPGYQGDHLSPFLAPCE